MTYKTILLVLIVAPQLMNAPTAHQHSATASSAKPTFTVRAKEFGNKIVTGFKSGLEEIADRVKAPYYRITEKSKYAKEGVFNKKITQVNEQLGNLSQDPNLARKAVDLLKLKDKEPTGYGIARLKRFEKKVQELQKKVEPMKEKLAENQVTKKPLVSFDQSLNDLQLSSKVEVLSNGDLYKKWLTERESLSVPTKYANQDGYFDNNNTYFNDLRQQVYQLKDNAQKKELLGKILDVSNNKKVTDDRISTLKQVEKVVKEQLDKEKIESFTQPGETPKFNQDKQVDIFKRLENLPASKERSALYEQADVIFDKKPTRSAIRDFEKLDESIKKQEEKKELENSLYQLASTQKHYVPPSSKGLLDAFSTNNTKSSVFTRANVPQLELITTKEVTVKRPEEFLSKTQVIEVSPSQKAEPLSNGATPVDLNTLSRTLENNLATVNQGYVANGNGVKARIKAIERNTQEGKVWSRSSGGQVPKKSLNVEEAWQAFVSLQKKSKKKSNGVLSS